jgi:hypothetical protein
VTIPLPPTEQPAATAPAQTWPQWVGTAAVTAGALAVPLVVVAPPLGLLLALAALGVGVAGIRSHRGAARRSYQWATGLGAAACLVLVVAAVGLMSASESSSHSGTSSVVSVPASPSS